MERFLLISLLLLEIIPRGILLNISIYYKLTFDCSFVMSFDPWMIFFRARTSCMCLDSSAGGLDATVGARCSFVEVAGIPRFRGVLTETALNYWPIPSHSFTNAPTECLLNCFLKICAYAGFITCHLYASLAFVISLTLSGGIFKPRCFAISN